jgi:excisionase family DNA binding protein
LVPRPTDPSQEIRGDLSNTSQAGPFVRAERHGDHEQTRNTRRLPGARRRAERETRTDDVAVRIVVRNAIASIATDQERSEMDRLLTADELADRLGMKTEWVWAQARAGRIPHVRLGRYRRFRESAVEAWLRDLETGGSGRAAPAQTRPIPLRRRA